MSKLSKVIGELQTMRAFATKVQDSALRINLLAKINEVERLVQETRREVKA